MTIFRIPGVRPTTLVALILAMMGCPLVPETSTEQPAQPQPDAALTQSDWNAPEKSKGHAIPTTVEDRFNVAFVYVGPVGSGGWTYAHDQGRKHLESTLADTVHTAYIESVSEGADAEQVIRALARKGFDLIVATSFGYMDACEAIAEEFPDVKFVHVSGFKKNDTNFGNLFGAMEEMKYLAGMIAGARAEKDGNRRIGYIAPFPIAEVIRLGNAVTLGARQTCPACSVEVRWINTWFDPTKEREAADSLLEAGVQVVVTGADTPGPLVAAGEKGRYGVGYDSENACSADPDHCLTVPYWNWGPTYVELVQQMQAGTWKPADAYLGADTGLVALYGFMEGQEVPRAVPEDVVPRVRETLAKMQAGEFTRFDVFGGPLRNNTGGEVIPAGKALTQEDLEGISGIAGRPDCTVCMSWMAEGMVGSLP